MNSTSKVERLFNFYANFIYKRGLKLTSRVGFTLLLLVGLLSTSIYQEFSEQTKLREHSTRVLSNLHETHISWNNVVAAQQAYLLTSQIDYYDQFYHNVKTVFTKLNDIIILTMDDFEHQKELAVLRNQLDEKISKMEYSVKLVRNLDPQTAITNYVKSSSELSIENINAQFVKIEIYENSISKKRATLLKEQSDRLIIVIVTSIVVSFVLLWAVTELLRNDLKSRKKSQKELYLAREKALQASQSKSDFLAKMSHEIRTPLNAIIGLCDVLIDSKLDPEQRKYTNIMQRSGQTLLALINDVLDLSKVESGKIELSESPMNLSECILFCVDLLSYRASQKGLVLDSQIDIKNLNVIADQNRLQQVLVNLVSNAIKFTKEGKVTLSLVQLKTSSDVIQNISKKISFQFAVTDTGVGISPEEQETVFQKFHQVADHQDFKDTYAEGTGLGLTISKELVALMGADIKLESEVDVGSKFYFTLELEPVIEIEKEICAEKHSLMLQNHHVLIVDDNQDNRLLLETYLKKSGHTFDSAENGEQAVSMVKTNSYSVALMDMHMPVMDGYLATRTIRQWESENNRARLPIVALTAYALEEDKSKILMAGCDLHLTKPIRKETLFKALNQFLYTKKSVAS